MRKLVAALACRINGSRLYGKPLQNLDIEKDIKPSNCGLFCRCMALNNAMESVMNPPSDMSPNFVT